MAAPATGPSRRPGLCWPAMETAWPDNIEPLRAGLTDEEFADLLDQERWTEDEAAMLRAAGMRVVTPEEARAGFIPPDQLRPSRGHVVWDPATGSHLVASAWAHYRHATLDQELEAGLLTSLPEGTPVPFWLAMIRPVAVDFGQDLLDALELPGLDDQAGWGAVDAEMLDMAAAAHLTVGPHPWLLPLTYMRGSLARDLVARPLRPLADWLAGYPHLLPAHLGGAEVVGTELAHWNQQAQRGPTAVPFWEALQLPADISPPPQRHQVGKGGAGHPDTEVDQLARQLARGTARQWLLRGPRPAPVGGRLVAGHRPHPAAEGVGGLGVRHPAAPDRQRSDRRTTHPPMSPGRPGGTTWARAPPDPSTTTVAVASGRPCA
jgi:hypothetical protein